MSEEQKMMDIILAKLDELIDLVKTNNTTKVENHTHHHYPTYPNYTYPTQYPWNSPNSISYAVNPGTTTTFSTNDPNGGPFNDPSTT